MSKKFKPTILYIEDDESTREWMSKSLEYLSEKLYLSKDGDEGFELYCKYKPDIIITDICMPNIKGIDMAKSVKEIDKNQHIIFMTAYSDSNYFLEAIDMQVDGFILKPVHLDKLTLLIDNVVQKIVLQKELDEKTKALELANKHKGEFLTNMSHEIRTPLNAIVGFISLLKDELKDNEKLLNYINIMNDSSETLLNVIEDILDFSKIENGKLEISKIDFNVIKEFEVITHLFDAKASQKNINLILNIDKDIPKVLNSDPLRIKQIVSNLLSNAIKFTQNSKNIFVNISYKNSNLLISVKDEGIGIAKDKLDYIFEAFNQADSSTTREYGGTGLGLAISSRLAELLDGKLYVESEEGVGSEFFLSIPAKEAKKSFESRSSMSKISFNGKKILLVEDNEANQVFMKIIFNKLSLRFDVASDGQEGIELYKNNKYDLILMDENMPRKNGILATKDIREYEELNNLEHTPIVALTASAIKGDRERFLEAGMDEYISKPISIKNLTDVLTKFL